MEEVVFVYHARRQGRCLTHQQEIQLSDLQAVSSTLAKALDLYHLF
jgi:hypothetical protein